MNVKSDLKNTILTPRAIAQYKILHQLLIFSNEIKQSTRTINYTTDIFIHTHIYIHTYIYFLNSLLYKYLADECTYSGNKYLIYD